MDHISCGLVTKKYRERKKERKRNCSPSSAKTDSRHQQQLAASSHHLGFLHCPSEPTEISFTNLNESFPSHLLTGGCAARALGNRQTDTNKRNEKEGKTWGQNNKFSFYFYRYVGDCLVYLLMGHSHGGCCWCQPNSSSVVLFHFASYPNVHFV
jgi:hypothetical protein